VNADTRRVLVGTTVLAAASGLPMGVLNELLPVYLRDAGASLAVVGALTGLLTPYTFKALWAPAVERFGTLRGWAMLCLAGVGVVVAGGGAWGPWLLPAFTVAAVLSATQDVAVDGWVVGIVPPAHQGRASGLRVAGYRAAMALSGGGAVWLAGRVSWTAAWAAVAALCFGLVAVMPALPAAPPAPARRGSDWWRELARWLTEPGALAALAFAVLYKLGDAAMAPMVKPFWLDSGLSLEDVGLYSVLLGSLLTAGGALVGGEIVSRVGQRRGVLLLGGLQLLSNLVYAATAVAPARTWILGAGAFESLSQGLGTAPLFAVLMRACGRDQPTVRYAILTAAAALSRVLAGAVSGLATAEWGYVGWFAFTAALALPALALAPLVSVEPGRGEG
jgi:PAT family beta-lactamase induction signal transducer AmpG